MSTTATPRDRDAHSPEPAWDVALLFPAQGCWSEQEYLAIAEGSRRLVELADGRLEVLPMPSLTHQRILMFLAKQLAAFVDARQLGEIIIAGYPVRLADRRFREPDIVFVSKAHQDQKRETFTSAADLAIEIVSPDDPARDYQTKRAEYAAAGVSEYWIVDPQQRTVTAFRIENDDYVEFASLHNNGQLTSQVLHGFQISVDAIFAAGEGRKSSQD